MGGVNKGCCKFGQCTRVMGNICCSTCKRSETKFCTFGAGANMCSTEASSELEGTFMERGDSTTLQGTLNEPLHAEGASNYCNSKRRCLLRCAEF